MIRKFKFDYDAKEDLLLAYNPDKKSHGAVDFGDLVVDMEKRGEIVALEFYDASKYLSDLTNKKISKSELKKIQKATLTFVKKKGTIIIKIALPIDKEKVPATITVPSLHYRSPATALAR